MGNSTGVLSSNENSGLSGLIQRHKNKSFNEKKFRYMGGKTFLKFFREDAWPLLEDVFERLNINEARGYELFRTFAIIDQNENGKICLNEIFQYLKFPRTKLTERLFDFSVQETRELEDFHNFSKKELDFREFALRIWNFCTLRHDGLARYLFEIFDVNETFCLSKNHIITMYHMLYNTNSEDIPVINRIITASNRNPEPNQNLHASVNYNNIELLKQILSAYQFLYDEKLHYYVIMKESFIETSTKTTYLIDPIISYQKQLQKKIGGILFWQTLTRYRYSHPLIKSYDFKSNTLQDSLDSIVQADEEFMSPKRRRANQTAEVLLRSKSEKLRTDREMIESEISSREKELELDTKKAGQNSFMQRMEKKWSLFRRAKEHFLHEEFTIEDAWRRREMRLKLYDFLDQAVIASKEFYAWKDKRDIEITEGTDLDHETRCHDFINNSLIQQHYDPRLQNSATGVGGGGSNSSGGVGNVMDAEEAVFHEIVMNNGKFIYGLLSLIKLYDIVLGNLQQEMETDVRKQQDPVYKEKVLTVTNTLNQLQQNYQHFRLLTPEDQSQPNPTLPENLLNPAVVVIDPFHPQALILSGSNEDPTTGKGGSQQKKEDSLEAILQKNEKQKRMKQLLSQMFIEERNLIRKYEKKTDDLLAQKQARDELLIELKEKMMKMCYRTIAKSQLQREKQYWKEEFDLMQNIGSRITRWEYVLEKNENKFYYMNIDTMELKHPKTAICEYCDAILIQNELKCDQCTRFRSPKNKLLYRPLGYKDITLE